MFPLHSSAAVGKLDQFLTCTLSSARRRPRPSPPPITLQEVCDVECTLHASSGGERRLKLT